MTDEDLRAFRANLHELSEHYIARVLEIGGYPLPRAKIAQEHLDQLHLARAEKANREGLKVAQSAKLAAWIAAAAAIVGVLVTVAAWLFPRH